MAHVLVLRECPSFVKGEGLINGTHEFVEENIANRMYEFNGTRKGYCIPNGSEFKLVWYRIKKECIPDFLRDLGAHNLNPPKVPWKTWLTLFIPMKLAKKWHLIPQHWYIGKAHILAMWLIRRFKFLKPAEASKGEGINFKKDKWCYDFFLGVIEDVDRGAGEEL